MSHMNIISVMAIDIDRLPFIILISDVVSKGDTFGRERVEWPYFHGEETVLSPM